MEDERPVSEKVLRPFYRAAHRLFDWLVDAWDRPGRWLDAHIPIRLKAKAPGGVMLGDKIGALFIRAACVCGARSGKGT
jgi:hypothetical protein